MVEILFSEAPDGDFVTITSENKIKSAKIMSGQKGKYLRIENEDGLVYLVSGNTIEVHGRLSDSQTVEKTLIVETEIYEVPVEKDTGYINEFITILRSSKSLEITEK